MRTSSVSPNPPSGLIRGHADIGILIGERRLTGGELRMKESYGEGVATHTGPESCVGVREGVGEALTGVRAGQPLSREIVQFRGVHAVPMAEGNTEEAAKARPPLTPRGLRPCACTETHHTGSGRSHDWPGEDGCPVRAVNPTGERRR